MSDAIEMMTALAGGTLAEATGPITVNSLTLYGQAPIGWGTTLYNLRSLVCSTGVAEPITFAANGGQLSLVTGAALDWMFYCRFTSNWPQDRHFRWHSGLAGSGPGQGQIDPFGTNGWYFSTPPVGPDGELVVDITATDIADPAEAFEIEELQFWLFR